MSIARGLPSAASRAIWGDLEDEDEIETGAITDRKENFCAGKERLSGWNSVPRTPGILNYSAFLARRDTGVDLRSSTHKEVEIDRQLHDKPTSFLQINSPNSSITPVVSGNSSVILPTQTEKNHQEIDPADDQHSPMQPSPSVTQIFCNDKIEQELLKNNLTKSIEDDNELPSNSQLPERVNETSCEGAIKTVEETQSSLNIVEVNSSTSLSTPNADSPELNSISPIPPALDCVHVEATVGATSSNVSSSSPQSLHCTEKEENISLLPFEDKYQSSNVIPLINSASQSVLDFPEKTPCQFQIENEVTGICNLDDENELCSTERIKLSDEFTPVEIITSCGPQEHQKDEKLINVINSDTLNNKAANTVVEDATTPSLYSLDESEKVSEDSTVLETAINTTKFPSEILSEITELPVPPEYIDGYEKSNSTSINELQQSMETLEIRSMTQKAVASSRSSISQIDDAEDEIREISVECAFSEVAESSHSLSNSISLCSKSPQQVDTIDMSQIIISIPGFPDEYSETLNISVPEKDNPQYLHMDSHSTRSSTSQYAVRDTSEAGELLKIATQTSLDSLRDKIQKEDNNYSSNYNSKGQNENAHDFEHDIPVHQTNSDDVEKKTENGSTCHDRNEPGNISYRTDCTDRNSVDEDNNSSNSQRVRDQSKENPNIVTEDSRLNALENNDIKEFQEPCTNDSKYQANENEFNVIMPDISDDRLHVHKRTTSHNKNLANIKYSDLDIKKKKHRYSHSGSSLLEKRKKSLREKIKVFSDKLHIHKPSS